MSRAAEKLERRMRHELPDPRRQKLLGMLVFCRWHRRKYLAHELRGDMVFAVDCPRCIEERKWLSQAYRELKVGEAEPERAAWVARAAEIGGRMLERYG